jgi:hypothetical protein
MAELPSTTNNTVTPKVRANLDRLAQGKKPDMLPMLFSRMQSRPFDPLGVLGLMPNGERSQKTKEYVPPAVQSMPVAPAVTKTVRRAAILTGMGDDEENIYTPKLGV